MVEQDVQEWLELECRSEITSGIEQRADLGTDSGQGGTGWAR
jgi:hypothetical protein